MREVAKAIHRVSEKALAWSPLIVAQRHAEVPERLHAVPRTARRRARDLRPDLGHGLRHDQLHDHRRAGRLVRLAPRPRRGRHRQRDVVLAPRPQHRLRPAGRAAARRRQQGADLRAALRRSSTRRPRASTRPAARATSPTRGSRAPSATTSPTAARHGRAGEDHRPGRHAGAGQVVFDFPVKLGKQPADGSADAGKDVFNGGLRVDITKLNAPGHLRRQRRHDAEGPVQGLRRPPRRRPRRRRLHHGRRGLQPVARLRAGRPDRRGQPAAGVNRAGQEGRVARAAGGRAEPARRRRADGRRVHAGPGDARPATRPAPPARAARLRRRQHRLLRGPQPLHPGIRERFAQLDPGRSRPARSRSTTSRSIVLADDPLPGGANADAYYGRAARVGRARAATSCSPTARCARCRGSPACPADSVAKRKLYVGQIAFGRSADERRSASRW